ncbi:MAG: sulfotransferase family protein [Angustibacter sp.]
MTSIRRLVPPAAQNATRGAYLGFGRATARLRLQPDFLLLGASRCGTTSLFRALTQHPQILRPPANKGVRYFDLNYHRGWSWYRGHFPLDRKSNRRTFEASGYYIFHPLAAERIARDLPQAKLVVMLRDPVERAFSAWKHESARGFETESFGRALELEEDRLRGEVARIRRNPRYASYCLRHHSHRSRGEYADQLARYLEKTPTDRLRVVLSEEFFARPEREYAALVEFLELPAHRATGFAVHNARPSAPMDPGLRRELSEHFAPHNQRLETLLARPLPWS